MSAARELVGVLRDIVREVQAEAYAALAESEYGIEECGPGEPIPLCTHCAEPLDARAIGHDAHWSDAFDEPGWEEWRVTVTCRACGKSRRVEVSRRYSGQWAAKEKRC